jgi:hypothetical protein
VVNRWLLGATLVVACNEEDDAPAPEDVEAIEGLSATQVLTRASLDVRSVRPTEAELDAVAADPTRVDAMIDAFVDDPAFGSRVRDIFAGAWRTRVDEYAMPGGEYVEYEATMHAAVGDEPLNIIAWVALNDLPFTEILRGNDTFVDPVLLATFPVTEVDAEGTLLPAGAVRARYTDGRPAAGVLAMNAVYWRHPSTFENANRGRANAISQALLCQSYLDRPIDFPTDLDLTDSESIRQAIKTNGACQACHSTMDPLASYMWGFMYPEETPRAEYAIEAEHGWRTYTEVAPGFFGDPGQRLQDLGEQIANDERFVACAVRRMYEGFLGRKVVLEDEGALAEHREAFLAGNLSLKALARSILADPSYRGQVWEPRFGGEPAPVTKKVAPVDVLARSLTDLSGYALDVDGLSATRLDYAVRTLAGGSDRGDALTVSTGAVLVQRRLAEAGAIKTIDRALAGKSANGRIASLLQGVDLEQPPTPELLARIARVTRSHAIDLDDPELVALIDLWTDVDAISGPREAWIAVITATLADPDHLLY